jgi:hypothetical protein
VFFTENDEKSTQTAVGVVITMTIILIIALLAILYIKRRMRTANCFNGHNKFAHASAISAGIIVPLNQTMAADVTECPYAYVRDFGGPHFHSEANNEQAHDNPAFVPDENPYLKPISFIKLTSKCGEMIPERAGPSYMPE